jgi:hypothetical protein
MILFIMLGIRVLKIRTNNIVTSGLTWRERKCFDSFGYPLWTNDKRTHGLGLRETTLKETKYIHI